MKILAFLAIVCLSVSPACNKTRIKKELKEFTGQQIVLPDDLRGTVDGRDSVLTGFMEAEAKLVVLYDSAVCSSCRINRLDEWEKAIATSIGLKHKFNVVFIFSPKAGGESQIITSLKAAKLGYPVFIDGDGQFLKQNPRIPAPEMYHTFLLDKENKVVLIGNPVGNDPLWKLYDTQIKDMIGRN